MYNYYLFFNALLIITNTNFLKRKLHNMLTITPGEIPTKKLFGYLLGSVAPRPIAFASTVDKDGKPNLSPFSFFNIFGANPPILVFSPSRRGRDNTTKDTFDNVKEVPEVVINTVNYNMVNQVSLASNEFEKGVNEFIKAGFTPINSELVKPFRVQESPTQFECKVLQVIETGTGGSAGNLVICEILRVHIDESILEEGGTIDPHKADLVGRMGKDFYCRASGDAIFEVEKPGTKVGIGIDGLPKYIRNSEVLTGNDLGRLGNLPSLPTKEDILLVHENSKYLNIIDSHSTNKDEQRRAIHTFVKEYMEQSGDLKTALAFCME